jgi:hypothetical protein
MAMHSKTIWFTWAFSFLLLISINTCKKKTPTTPDLDEVTKPKIWINVSAMSFAATESGLNPGSQTLQIKNSGVSTLNYSISDDANWLSILPSSGSSNGNIIEHTVSVDISGLIAKKYSGTISITASNATNSPQSVSVSLEISSPLADNEISVSCDPSSGGIGTVVAIPVKIKGNIQEIKAFGLELTYDTTMFEYQSVSKGDKTGDWISVDGNEVSSGTVRIGGFAGSAAPILKGSVGSIVKVTLKVTCSGCDDGKKSQICIQYYTDDIAGMTPKPSCATFIYNR